MSSLYLMAVVEALELILLLLLLHNHCAVR